MIRVENLRYSLRDGRYLLQSDHLHFEAGQFYALIGPNGAGKSTLLRCLCGDLEPSDGSITIANRALSTYTPAELALWRAVLPQISTVPFAISMHEIVAFGREVYRQHPAKVHDQSVIEYVMDLLDIKHLSNQHYQQLSGGEQHRAQIARTLAQLLSNIDSDLSGKVLFLDEPTNHLDIRHQHTLLMQLNQLKKRGLTIICVLHDLGLALNNADQLVLLDQGVTHKACSPDKLLTSNALDNTYHIALNAHWSHDYQRYVVMPSQGI
ncbi:ATP-binding cassette domain-containing protein [Suttonella sp. R2A3]|uniref:ATP-binding cassette domain-containing protein n=1 Tax=Suttonella sp. R2A3 TaxID=2908648 RepID=UPI001F19A411|nr:ATP-binding cassette domain-containing protein [Suttonella sp. R2A3]UJF25082.1 ATP-binding cassette domain-containing protein [Suttonella sp. R2A3]